MGNIKFDTDDVLSLASKYRRQACLEGMALYFVADLFNVSSDELDDMIDSYERQNN